MQGPAAEGRRVPAAADRGPQGLRGSGAGPRARDRPGEEPLQRHPAEDPQGAGQAGQG